MNRTRIPNAKNTAAFYYFQLTDIINRNGDNKIERCLEVFDCLKDFFSELTEDANQFFSNDFAQLVYIIDKFSLSPRLANDLKKFRYFLKHTLPLKTESDFTEENLSECIGLAADFVRFITGEPLPVRLAEIGIDEKGRLFTGIKRIKAGDRIDFLRCLIRDVDIDRNTLILATFNSDENLEFQPQGVWKDIVGQSVPGMTVNLIDVIKKDNKIINRDSSFIVLEPDYLMDATEIAEAFDFNGFNNYALLLKRISPKSVSAALVLGTVVNTVFDTLLNNPYADFENIYYQALKERILSIFTVAKQNSEDKINIKTEAKKQFSNLQNLVKRIDTERFAIEPSFISPKYGFQGRLDLLSEFNKDKMRKDIYELKSGKPPKIETFFQQDGLIVKTGVYYNHLAQITIYNLLLDTCYPGRKGISAIIYSRDTEHTVRNVPNFNKIKQIVVKARNSYISLENKLLNGDISLFSKEWDETFQAAPPWIKDDYSEFKKEYERNSSLGRDYYTALLKFMLNELRAMKLGTNKSGDGFASLWSLDVVEKKMTRGILTGLKINEKKSDFKNLHLTFSYNVTENSNSSLRTGDICVIYPTDSESEYAPQRGRLIKCSVKEIRNDEIVVSIRNKMYHLDFTSNDREWVLDFDSTDSLQKSIIHSLSGFLFANEDKQNVILGIKPPRFIAKDYQLPDYLSDEQKNILQKILNAEDYFLLQGPPGTGKTRYMLSALVETLIKQTNDRILVLAYTNRAIDEICSAIKRLDCVSAESFDIVRLGKADTTEHKDIVLPNLVKGTDINILYRELKKTRIYVATVATAVTYPELLDFVDFDIAIVDEAAQITESNLVGLLSQIKRFVLIGDERQLPAITMQTNISHVRCNANLTQIHLNDPGKSMFQRLLECAKSNNWHNAYALLTFQARMHSDIMEFPSKYFYNGSLKIFDASVQTAVNKKFQHSSKFFAKELARHRFLFINTPVEKHSKYNLSEADTVAQIIDTIAAEYDEIKDDTIGVISPFRMQCVAITKLLPEELRQKIVVDTVEKFQGSQRDYIIISLAVNFPYLLQKIQSQTVVDGQLIDRKLNVALTRARSTVILLGNASILQQAPIYANLIEYCKNKGVFFDVKELQNNEKL